MNTDNLVRYPASPSQFFAMLERVGQLGEWHIHHSPFSRPTATYFSLYSGGGTLPDEVALIYGEADLPVVKLGRLRFDLMCLFDAGTEWHPAVYRDNSFMPWQFKEFLDQLFAVLIGDRNLRTHAMAVAA
jgi:hypothetical protein